MAEQLTSEDFTRLYQFIQQHYGIDLSKKKELVASRLVLSLKSYGYVSFHDLVNDVVAGRRPDLIDPLLGKLTTNYTYFMREEEHFRFLQRTVLPELSQKHRRDRNLAIWSAGCSSGEEPYTISMCLKDYFGIEGDLWDTRILATDISDNMLEKAVNPVYGPDMLGGVPETWKKRYFRQLPDGNYTVTDAIRQNVIFRQFNLMDPILFRRKFDVIFCRNVMIYFDQKTKDALIRRFYDATVPGGYLFIGHSEGLSKGGNPYSYVVPAVYRKMPAGK